MSVDVEKILRPVDNPAPPYPPKMLTLANGEPMVIRQIGREDIPEILPYVEPLLHVERDYYDVVAARLYGELLAYQRHRVQDEYVLVAQVNGELCAIVNGRRETPETGMSYHTVALRRGLRIGAHAFAAKMEYHLDIMGQREVLIVAESPIGHRRWMIEYSLEKRFEKPHELGGVPTFVLTKALFDARRETHLFGTRDIPKKILEKACERILPPSDPPKPPVDLVACTRSMGDPTGTALNLSKWKLEGRR